MSDVDVFTLGQEIPPGELAEHYVKIEDQPYGNADLAYSIVLPNDWIQIGLQASDSALHSDKPKLLANFSGPTDQGGNAMLQVWAQDLEKEISAADWLKHYLISSGRKVDFIQAASPYFADAVATWEIEQITQRIRVIARVSGNRVFFVQGVVPHDLYAQYADKFGLAIASFKVAVEPKNPHVELWQTHTLDEHVICNAPYSWPEKKADAPEGLDLVNLFNLAADGSPVSVIKIMTARKALMQGKPEIDLSALLAMEFIKMGVEVAEVATDEAVAVAAPFVNGRLKVLTASLPQGDNRLRNLMIAEFGSPTHQVLAGLLTCAPKEGFYEYAVNRRAFDIVLETMRLAAP